MVVHTKYIFETVPVKPHDLYMIYVVTKALYITSVQVYIYMVLIMELIMALIIHFWVHLTTKYVLTDQC